MTIKFIGTILMAAAGIALANGPARAEVFIPLGAEDRIVIVDPLRDTVIGDIKRLPQVHGLAGTPDGRLLIAGSYEERPAGGAAPPRPATVGADEHESHHAVPAPGKTPAGTPVSTLSIIRASDRAVTRRVDVPGAVHHVAASPDGRLAAVTHPNQGTISIVDLDSFTVTTTIATGPSPNYGAFSPDGRRLYVSNAGNNTVSIIDTGPWIVMRNVITGKAPEHIVLSKDGRQLFVNNVKDGTVSVVSTGEARVESTIPVGAGLHGIDLSDDEQMLYVAATDDNSLAAIDLQSGKIRRIALSPAPYHLTVARGTGKIYVSSATEPKLWIIDGKALATRDEIRIGGKGHQIFISPQRGE
ncbi:MAG: YncE family protein [Alphaproteobacteria bacterium]